VQSIRKEGLCPIKVPLQSYLMNKKNNYILIDLYNGSSEILPFEEAKEAVLGLKKKKGDVNVWKGEGYMVVEVLD
jgi:hypothetical protein